MMVETSRRIFPALLVSGLASGCALLSIAVLASAPATGSPEMLGGLAVGTLATAALIVAHRGRLTATTLAIVAVLLVDFGPLNIWRYFLLSDALLIAAAAVVLRKTSPATAWAPTAIVMGAYVLSLLMAFSNAPVPVRVVFSVLHVLFISCVYLPAATVVFAAESGIRRAAPVLVFCSGVLQAVVIIGRVAAGDAWSTGSRMSGALGNAQQSIFAAAIAAGVLLLLSPRLTARVAAVAGLPLLIFAIAVLRSRMLWASSMVAVLLTAATVPVSRIRGTLLALTLLLLPVVCYQAGVLPAAVEQRVRTLFQPTASYDLVARVEAVRILWREYQQSPITGIGAGASDTVLPESLVAGHVDAAHNMVLHATIEYGILAGVAWVLLPIAAFALRFRAVRTSLPDDRPSIEWAFAAFIGIYAGAQFTPTMYEHLPYMLLALLGGWTASVRRERRDRAAPVA